MQAEQGHHEAGVLVRRQRQLAAPDRHDLIGQLDEFGRQRPRQQLDAFAIGIIVIARFRNALHDLNPRQ